MQDLTPASFYEPLARHNLCLDLRDDRFCLRDETLALAPEALGVPHELLQEIDCGPVVSLGDQAPSTAPALVTAEIWVLVQPKSSVRGMMTSSVPPVYGHLGGENT